MTTSVRGGRYPAPVERAVGASVVAAYLAVCAVVGPVGWIARLADVGSGTAWAATAAFAVLTAAYLALFLDPLTESERVRRSVGPTGYLGRGLLGVVALALIALVAREVAAPTRFAYLSTLEAVAEVAFAALLAGYLVARFALGRGRDRREQPVAQLEQPLPQGSGALGEG